MSIANDRYSGLTKSESDGVPTHWNCFWHGDVSCNVISFNGTWFCCACIAEMLKTGLVAFYKDGEGEQ